MNDNPGHFRQSDAEKLARFYRQQGTRGTNRPGRQRRRVTRSATTESGESGDDGSFTCCQCTNSKLYVSLKNSDTIEWEKITFPKSLVASGEITHKIRLTCKADGATLDVTLPVLDCETTDCQVHDLTGTSVGGCDVGKIYFGNSETCSLPTGCSSPDYSFSSSGGVSAGGLQYSILVGPVGAETVGWNSYDFEFTLVVAGTNTTASLEIPGVDAGGIGYWDYNINTSTSLFNGLSFPLSGSTTWTAGDVVKITFARNTTDTSTDDFRCSLFKNGSLVGFKDTTSTEITVPIDTAGGLCGARANASEPTATTAQYSNATANFT